MMILRVRGSWLRVVGFGWMAPGGVKLKVPEGWMASGGNELKIPGSLALGGVKLFILK